MHLKLNSENLALMVSNALLSEQPCGTTFAADIAKVFCRHFGGKVTGTDKGPQTGVTITAPDDVVFDNGSVWQLLANTFATTGSAKNLSLRDSAIENQATLLNRLAPETDKGKLLISQLIPKPIEVNLPNGIDAYLIKFYLAHDGALHFTMCKAGPHSNHDALTAEAGFAGQFTVRNGMPALLCGQQDNDLSVTLEATLSGLFIHHKPHVHSHPGSIVCDEESSVVRGMHYSLHKDLDSLNAARQQIGEKLFAKESIEQHVVHIGEWFTEGDNLFRDVQIMIEKQVMSQRFKVEFEHNSIVPITHNYVLFG